MIITASNDPTIADDFESDVLTKALGINATSIYNNNTDEILSPKKKWTIAARINAQIIEMNIPLIVAPIVSDTSIILPPFKIFVLVCIYTYVYYVYKENSVKNNL